jgi:hypothetical protein
VVPSCAIDRDEDDIGCIEVLIRVPSTAAGPLGLLRAGQRRDGRGQDGDHNLTPETSNHTFSIDLW